MVKISRLGISNFKNLSIPPQYSRVPRMNRCSQTNRSPNDSALLHLLVGRHWTGTRSAWFLTLPLVLEFLGPVNLGFPFCKVKVIVPAPGTRLWGPFENWILL